MSIAAIDDAGVTMAPASQPIVVPWSAWRYGAKADGAEDDTLLVSAEVGGFAFAIPIQAGAMAERVHAAYRRIHGKKAPEPIAPEPPAPLDESLAARAANMPR